MTPMKSESSNTENSGQFNRNVTVERFSLPIKGNNPTTESDPLKKRTKHSTSQQQQMVSRFKLLIIFVVILLVSYHIIITTMVIPNREKHPVRETVREPVRETFLSTEATKQRVVTVDRQQKQPEKYIFYGQVKEDQLMLKYFMKEDGTPLHHGTFIEIGALDGVTYSNSKFYEDSLGWNGLLIEPQPDTFARLQRNRPKAVTARGAVCIQERTIEMIGHGAMAGRKDTLDSHHQKVWKEEKTWTLECSPIRKYVEAANLKRVDFFSVDVEGAEYEVLATYPYDSVPVYAILIELNGREGSKEKDEQCRQLLREKGFIYLEKFGHGGFNEVWVNPNNKRPELQSMTVR